MAAREADTTPRLALSEVRDLVQHENKPVALDVMVRSGFPPQSGTGLHDEVFWKHWT